ncbi:MFS transporter [Aliikangiella sp. G2MR2-5]|uniref:MFS transporter n=1 Tax=Aliikangiella sp. G2MR2-5 TaxID=2788943 RepID=UPI001AEDFB5F|nr:MFS transporter [Aliikangiella sp. G2MR2-5]
MAIPYTLLATLFAFIIFAFIARRLVKLPANVWLLFLAQPLGMCSSAIIVFAGGIVATKIAAKPELATLPLTVMILGTASAVIPASMLMKKVGRRKGTMIGLGVAILGAILCMFASLNAEFGLLVSGSFLLGSSMAFVAQMRFAAIESLPDIKDSPKAISVLMIGGIFAAILGPEAAIVAKDWIDSPHGFAGSFLILAVFLVVALTLISLLKPIGFSQESQSHAGRPLLQIIRQPVFIISACAGGIAYSVMSYIMTATPLSMHEVDGHSLQHTKWVVQSHIIAMYLPSLFSASLIRYLGLAKLMIIGSLLYLAVVIIGISGNDYLHYWWVMVLLGIGWNFLFTSGTLLLPEAYSASERFKTQAVNDFSIFFAQAMASLSAGFVLFGYGWTILLNIAIPAVLIMFAVSIWYLTGQRKNLRSTEN